MEYYKYKTLIYDDQTYCILNSERLDEKGRPTLKKEDLEQRTATFLDNEIRTKGMGGAMEFIKAPDHFWNYWLGRLGYL
jgi:hypothetical protein